MEFEFPWQKLEKNTQIPSFMKIRPHRTELFHADGRTDRRTDVKLIVAFCNFTKQPVQLFHLV